MNGSGINPEDTDAPISSNASGTLAGKTKAGDPPPMSDDQRWLRDLQLNYKTAINFPMILGIGSSTETSISSSSNSQSMTEIQGP